MAIKIRNNPVDSGRYKVVDVALASGTGSSAGVRYDPSINQTIVNVVATETNHNAIKLGDFMIPQRADSPAAITDDNRFDILNPLNALRVVNKTTSTGARTISLEGDQRKYFAGLGSPNLSPSAYGLTDITVADIVKGRKYRITKLGETTWGAFGDLYNAGDSTAVGKNLAVVGTTFVARASGSSVSGEVEDLPEFTTSFYQGGIGNGDSPYFISGITAVGREFINGEYRRRSSTIYEHQTENLQILLRGQPGRWVIWNPETRKIYYEDSNAISDITHRFDSPSLADSPDLRGGTFNNTPSIVWTDRSVSVATNQQYGAGGVTAIGEVAEVVHFSSVISDNRPLTNQEIDGNFLDLENNKFSRDGSQPLTGDLSVTGKITGADTLDITKHITVGGVTLDYSNTGLALGDKDLEVNNIYVSGDINSDALFRKYKVVGFPHSFLADYNTRTKGLEPCTVLYFSTVSDFNVGDTITSLTSTKIGVVRRINNKEGYILVKESSSNKSYQVGEFISGVLSAGPILKRLEPNEYIAAGQNLKIFGMQQNDTPLETTFSTTTITRPIRPSAPVATRLGTNVGTDSISYKVAVFNKVTGKMSLLSAASNVITDAPILDDFDKDNNIRITNISRKVDEVVLLYRNVQRTDGSEFLLADIFDDIDFNNVVSDSGALTVTDYGGYDKTGWGINSSPGNYTVKRSMHDITYIPVTETESALATGEESSNKDNLGFIGSNLKYRIGFLETQVSSDGIIKTTDSDSTSSPSYFRILETENTDSPNILGDPIYPYNKTNVGQNSPYYNSPNQVSVAGALIEGGTNLKFTTYGKANELEFYIDNARIIDSPAGSITGGIQKMILDANISGGGSLSLPAGTYYSKLLTIPSNFKFGGQSSTNTTLKALPWLGNTSNTKNFIGGNVTLNAGIADGAYTTNASTGKLIKTAVRYFGESNDGEIRQGQTGPIQRFSARVTSNAQEDSTSGIFANLFVGDLSYSRTILDADGKSGVTVSNIKIDGNYQNNTTRNIDVSGKSNFPVAIQFANETSLEDVSVVNTTGGGIFASNGSNVKILSSRASKGGSKIYTNAFGSGLYAPDSEKLRIATSLIEDFNAPVDITSNSNTVLTSNIIKNTGSGVLAYATTNLVKEGNLVLGPSNENIPIVDALNSEYDELNIDLTNDSTFSSEIIQYIRDDSPVDLRPANINAGRHGVILDAKIRTLVQRGLYSYTLPGNINGYNFDYTFGSPSVNTFVITTPTAAESDTEASLQNGNFQLAINAAKVDSLLKNASYNDIKTKYDAISNLRPSDENLIGLVYNVEATEYLFLGPTDTKITYSAFQFKRSQKQLILRVSEIFAPLFAIGDRVVFKVGTFPAGESDPGLNTLSLVVPAGSGDGVDMNGQPAAVHYGVANKVNFTGSTFELVLDISAAGDSLINALPSDQASFTNISSTILDECRLGIQNTFVLTKGRIII